MAQRHFRSVRPEGGAPRLPFRTFNLKYIELQQSVPPLPSVGTLTPNLWVSLHASHKIKFTFCKLNIKLNLSSHFSNSQVQKPAVSILCTFEQVFTLLGRPSLQKLRNTNWKQVNINCTFFTFSAVEITRNLNPSPQSRDWAKPTLRMQFKLSYLKSNLNSLEKSLKHKLNWVNVLLWSEIHNSQYDQILSNRLNTILGDRHGRYKEEDGEAVEWDIRGRGIEKQAEETFVQESFFLDPYCPLRRHQSSQRGRGGEIWRAAEEYPEEDAGHHQPH